MPANYFKQRHFNRLFQELKNKYISLGRYSGTVTIKNLSREESIDLSNFFGTKIKEKTDLKTSFKKIENKLKETKYADFTWDKLFKDYFNEIIITKKQTLSTEKQEENNFYNDIIKNTSSKTKKWLINTIETKNSTYQIFKKRYKKNKQKFKEDLTNLIYLIDITKEVTPTSLPILSSYIGNPHFLDLNGQNNILFIKALSFITNKQEPKTTQEKIIFLKENNIHIDTYSNYVITYKLISDSPLINTFDKNNEVLNLNLSNLENINKLDTKNKKVFIFENPSMLSALKHLNVPIIIVYGMPNYIVYKVLEKLEKTNNTLYYNGDFDPEGLIIAQKLKENFKKLNLFCYQEKDYETSKSINKISPSSLSKLNSITTKELLPIKQILETNQIAGYQEKNIKKIEKYIKDITN